MKRRADSLGLSFEDDVPEFLRAAGWGELSGAFDESKAAGSFDEAKPGAAIAKGDLPAWIQAMAPSDADRPSDEAVEELPHVSRLPLSNGMELLPVPAGRFWMGSTKENKLASADERPQHSVEIPYAYLIARFPVTNEHFYTYVKAQGIKHPVDGWESKADHPVVSVRWNEAVNYCRWLNEQIKVELHSNLILRLPTEAEWEKAARGTDGREYPWGTAFDKKKCNTQEGGKVSTTPVGLYVPQGDSPYGCADMAGNVWEWTQSSLKPYPYKANDGRDDENTSGTRVLRRGSFKSSEGYARCAVRFVNPVNFLSDDIGFRVVASLEVRAKQNR